MPNGGGEAFQAFTNIDAIAFDKTGTITKGKFQVSDCEVISAQPELWRMVSKVEEASTHPIALAVHVFAQEKVSLPLEVPETSIKLEAAEEKPGRGMWATIGFSDVSKLEILIGNEEMIRENGCDIPDQASTLIQRWQAEGKSIILVAVLASSINGGAALIFERRYKLSAILAVADPLRPEATFVLDYFARRGIATYIVSGDGEATVKAVARTLEIPLERVVGGALPEDKRHFVENLQQKTKTVRSWNGRLEKRRRLVCFVGDGINDAIGRFACSL